MVGAPVNFNVLKWIQELKTDSAEVPDSSFFARIVAAVDLDSAIVSKECQFVRSGCAFAVPGHSKRLAKNTPYDVVNLSWTFGSPSLESNIE